MADYEQDLLDLASSKPKKKRVASAMNGGSGKGSLAKKRKVEKSAERIQSDEDDKPIDPDETESEAGPMDDGHEGSEVEDDEEDADLESEDGAPAPQRRRESSNSDGNPEPISTAPSTVPADDDEDDEEEDMDIDMDIESEDGAPAPVAAIRTPSSATASTKPASASAPKAAAPLRFTSTSRPALNPRSSSGQQKPTGKNAQMRKNGQGTGSRPAMSKRERELKEKYPLDEVYIDEDDRERIDNLPDFERDNILAERADELQKLRDQIALEKMFVERGGEASTTADNVRSDAEDDGDDYDASGIAGRGGRSKKSAKAGSKIRREGSDEEAEDDEDEEGEQLGRGATRRSAKDDEKARERDVLKEARKAKAERTAEKQAKQRRGSPTRKHSDSEGSAAGYGERPRSNKKRYGKAGSDYDDSADSEDRSAVKRGDESRAGSKKSRTEAERERREDPVKMEDIEGCKLSRYQLAEMKHRDCFAELVVGSYVRGPAPPTGDPHAPRKTRIYLVVGLEEPAPVAYMMEYKLKQIPENRRIRVKYGNAQQKIKMDGISNSAFTNDEFARWKAMSEHDKDPLPLRSELKERRLAMYAMITKPITETEITRRIAAMSTLGRPSGMDTSQAARIRLEAERGLAIRRHDVRALEAVDKELKALDASAPAALTEPDETQQPYKGEGGAAELSLLARVNERNRKMAVESSRRAHLANLDRRRAMEEGKVMDSSARVKSKMKLHDSTMFNQTPGETPSGPVDPTASTNGSHSYAGVTAPTPALAAVLGKKGSVAVDLDLGDF